MVENGLRTETTPAPTDRFILLNFRLCSIISQWVATPLTLLPPVHIPGGHGRESEESHERHVGGAGHRLELRADEGRDSLTVPLDELFGFAEEAVSLVFVCDCEKVRTGRPCQLLNKFHFASPL